MGEGELLKKRFSELAAKAYNGGYYTFTDFLGLPEQAAFREVERMLIGKHESFGGAKGAERIMIRFGDSNELGYDADYPIVCIKAEPLSQKFADKLTHRDFLGALLNLGIERSTLGDIVIRDNVGYIFAKEDISEFIVRELARVKRTDIRVSIIEALPEGELFKTERRQIQISSERVDAIIAKVFSLSRDDAATLVKRRMVFVNGKQIESVSYNVKPDEKVSVRGHGRFIYVGYDTLTRKGKLNATVELYV